MRVSGIPYVQGRNAYADPDGTKYAIAIHNTSNTASAEAEASYATRRTDGVSSHFYCDGDSVIQSLDTAVKAGHAGSGNGNNNAVAVEITGTNDKSRQWWLDNVAWEQLGQVLAVVCKAYGIAVRRASVAEMRANPKVRAFYSHDDMRQAWGGTTHTDPGPNFPWDRLFEAVNAAMSGGSMAGEADAAFSRTYTGTEPWVSGQSWMAKAVEAPLRTTVELLKAIASKVDIDATELAAIEAAARAGAAAAADDVVARVLAGLPESALTKADVEQAIRSVLGGLDGAAPA